MGIIVICIIITFLTFIIAINKDDLEAAVAITIIPIVVLLIIGIPIAMSDPNPEYHIEEQHIVKAVSEQDVHNRYNVYFETNEKDIDLIEGVKFDIVSDDVKAPKLVVYKSKSEMYFSQQKIVLYMPRDMELSDIMIEME